MQKAAIVTGASRGIGRACAIRLASLSYTVIINCSKSVDELKETEQIIAKNGGKCICYIGDISLSEVAIDLYNIVKDNNLSLEVLINNAGISKVGLLQNIDFAEWNQIVNINLSSVFNMCKLAIPHMLAVHNGHIINISSVWGLCGASCEVAYSATKGAINSLTKALGKELAPSGISVNAIACGLVNTSMNSCFTKEELDLLTQDIPIGRMIEPDEVATCVEQLINMPSSLTGEVIKLDGGWI